jgi:zinc and cadmium transporter
MTLLLIIMLSVFIVSLVSLIGVLALGMRPKFLNNIIFVLVSFAAGAMLGAAFLDLLPEALEKSLPGFVFGLTLAGITVFFILETFLLWYHCHSTTCERHSKLQMHKAEHKHVKMPFTYLNLIGDCVHNFFDGVIIATSYMAGIPLGIITTLAVLFHEIPQEIGDFSILVYGGFKRTEAIAYNFLSALPALAGAFLAYVFATSIHSFTQWLVPFAAGGFIYIASVDLLPELHQAQKFRKALVQLFFFLLGIGIIYAATELIAH